MDPDTIQPDPGSQVASATEIIQLATVSTVEDVLPAVSERPFRFEDLPAELRVNVKYPPLILLPTSIITVPSPFPMLRLSQLDCCVRSTNVFSLVVLVSNWTEVM